MKTLKLKHTLQLSIAEVNDHKEVANENNNIIKVNNAKHRGAVIEQNNKIDLNEPVQILSCIDIKENFEMSELIELLRKQLNSEFDVMEEKFLELYKKDNKNGNS